MRWLLDFLRRNLHGEKDIVQAHHDRQVELHEEETRAERNIKFQEEQREIEKARRRLDFILERTQNDQH